MKPRKGNAPRRRMDDTLGLWSFDDLDAMLQPARAEASGVHAHARAARQDERHSTGRSS